MATFAKICPIHNVQYERVSTTKKFVCKRCRSEAVQRRRERVKVLGIQYKGGCCVRCGYNKCVAALEFHHLNPSQKEFGIAHKGITRSWDKVKIELDKCILVCSNCHREIENCP